MIVAGKSNCRNADTGASVSRYRSGRGQRHGISAKGLRPADARGQRYRQKTENSLDSDAEAQHGATVKQQTTQRAARRLSANLLWRVCAYRCVRNHFRAGSAVRVRLTKTASAHKA